MPSAEALAIGSRWRACLLATGVPQVSIEPQIGRSGRWVSTGPFGGTSFVANLGHHIASKPSASNPTPGLAVVKYGRPGLSAPLSNAYGGMDLVARLICLDWANHPGEGGPWTIDGYRVPRDSGRPYLFGWEHEGGYSDEVWDAVYTNPATGISMTYREFMGRCHAGTLMFLGRPYTSHGEHSTWADLKQPGRKIDRRGYDRARGIAELKPYYGTTEQQDWFDMADEATLERVVERVLAKPRGDYGGGSKLKVRLRDPGPARYSWLSYQFLRSFFQRSMRLRTDGDVKYSSATTTLEQLLVSNNYYSVLGANKSDQALRLAQAIANDVQEIAAAVEALSGKQLALASARVADETAAEEARGLVQAPKPSTEEHAEDPQVSTEDEQADRS